MQSLTLMPPDRDQVPSDVNDQYCQHHPVNALSPMTPRRSSIEVSGQQGNYVMALPISQSIIGSEV
ncbi:hypothetical protein [Phaffia rhodozyma]|uniref:Uncharacterized protein n=1 Tax=Phaffia rhodozyma TaxID=264483 RepID=A0A0F7SG08_PHARH|nr:hypothetical protein [Phaffia rhodozyma]